MADMTLVKESKKPETDFVGFQLETRFIDAVKAIAEEQGVKVAVIWRAIVAGDQDVKRKLEEMEAAQ